MWLLSKKSRWYHHCSGRESRWTSEENQLSNKQRVHNNEEGSVSKPKVGGEGGGSQIIPDIHETSSHLFETPEHPPSFVLFWVSSIPLAHSAILHTSPPRCQRDEK